jgi:hypothetical protein
VPQTAKLVESAARAEVAAATRTKNAKIRAFILCPKSGAYGNGVPDSQEISFRRSLLRKGENSPIVLCASLSLRAKAQAQEGFDNKFRGKPKKLS